MGVFFRCLSLMETIQLWFCLFINCRQFSSVENDQEHDDGLVLEVGGRS